MFLLSGVVGHSCVVKFNWNRIGSQIEITAVCSQSDSAVQSRRRWIAVASRCHSTAGGLLVRIAGGNNFDDSYADLVFPRLKSEGAARRNLVGSVLFDSSGSDCTPSYGLKYDGASLGRTRG